MQHQITILQANDPHIFDGFLELALSSREGTSFLSISLTIEGRTCRIRDTLVRVRPYDKYSVTNIINDFVIL